MKKIFLLALTSGFLFTSIALAEYVNGYTKKNGTYVNGYNRSDRNSTVTDNYSYAGNTNPYTGAVGTNYYRNDPSSEYYNGGSQPYQFAGSMSQNNFANSSGNSFANTSRYNSTGFFNSSDN